MFIARGAGAALRLCVEEEGDIRVLNIRVEENEVVVVDRVCRIGGDGSGLIFRLLCFIVL